MPSHNSRNNATEIAKLLKPYFAKLKKHPYTVKYLKDKFAQKVGKNITNKSRLRGTKGVNLVNIKKWAEDDVHKELTDWKIRFGTLIIEGSLSANKTLRVLKRGAKRGGKDLIAADLKAKKWWNKKKIRSNTAKYKKTFDIENDT